MKDDINQKVEPHVPLPDLVNTAYTILGNDWNETRKRWEQEGAPTPPVMITVANLTHTAARVDYALSHEKIPIEKLGESEGILHIDSKVLGEAEAQEEAVEIESQRVPMERIQKTMRKLQSRNSRNSNAPSSFARSWTRLAK